MPETLVYKLRANNGVVRVEASFDKNPVGTYDYTVLELNITPLLNFPLPIQHIALGFSDESLNKVATTSNSRSSTRARTANRLLSLRRSRT